MTDRDPRRIEAVPLALLAGVVVITVAWWALALWPLPDDAPAWLARTRAVCFGSGASGLPDASGWIALVVQPAVMLGVAGAGWGRGIAGSLRGLARSRSGRAAVAGAGLLVATGMALAALRVARAAEPVDPLPEEVHLLDGPAPPLTDLVDQRGEPVSLERFHGRPLIVTFAFGHCETVCPLVVEGALEARRQLDATGTGTALVVVTLDPWRDTPSRLPSLAERWDLDSDARVASGDVAAVEAVLDAWGVARSRDPRTGDVVHPPLVHVIGPRGDRIGVTGGNPDALVELVREMVP